jgi:hypothetical protein
MKFWISGFGVLASLGFIAASGMMNFFYWSSQGAGEWERLFLGVMSGSADAFKCLLPFYIWWASEAKKRLFVVVGSGAFSALLLFGFCGSLGFAAMNRGLVAGGRDALAERLQGAEREKAGAEERHAALGPHRAAAVIEQALNGMQQDRRFGASERCTAASGPSARTFCKGYFDVKAELEAAVEADRLQERISRLGSEVAQLKAAGCRGGQRPAGGLCGGAAGASQREPRPPGHDCLCRGAGGDVRGARHVFRDGAQPGGDCP